VDRIEKIKKLQQEGYKVPRNQNTIINNLFSIATIVLVCTSIIIYTAYVVPAQNAKKDRAAKIAQKELERQLYLEKRAKQIALSHKLNNPNYKSKNDTNTSKQ
jgi:hypothetical protein